jgi:hypothetical protein
MIAELSENPECVMHKLERSEHKFPVTIVDFDVDCDDYVHFCLMTVMNLMNESHV